MKDMDKIANRVQAARASLARFDADHERQISRLSRQLSETKEVVAKQNAALDQSRAESGRLEQEVRELSAERRRYKELLMSLLNAIEERETGAFPSGGEAGNAAITGEAVAPAARPDVETSEGGPAITAKRLHARG